MTRRSSAVSCFNWSFDRNVSESFAVRRDASQPRTEVAITGARAERGDRSDPRLLHRVVDIGTRAAENSPRRLVWPRGVSIVENSERALGPVAPVPPPHGASEIIVGDRPIVVVEHRCSVVVRRRQRVCRGGHSAGWRFQSNILRSDRVVTMGKRVAGRSESDWCAGMVARPAFGVGWSAGMIVRPALERGY